MRKLVSKNILSELLVKVTETNQTKPDTDATIDVAKEDKNYQKEVNLWISVQIMKILMKMFIFSILLSSSNKTLNP